MNFVELYGSKEILSRYSQIVISNTQRKAVKDWLHLLHDDLVNAYIELSSSIDSITQGKK